MLAHVRRIQGWGTSFSGSHDVLYRELGNMRPWEHRNDPLHSMHIRILGGLHMTDYKWPLSLSASCRSIFVQSLLAQIPLNQHPLNHILEKQQNTYSTCSLARMTWVSLASMLLLAWLWMVTLQDGVWVWREILSCRLIKSCRSSARNSIFQKSVI